MNIARIVSLICITATLGACATDPNTPNSSPTSTAKSAVADISGNWIVTVHSPQGAVDAKMTVIQSGSALKGTLDSAMGLVDYTGSLNGKEVKFSYGVERFGAPAGTIISYVGTVEGSAMKGKATFGSFGGGDWSARRP